MTALSPPVSSTAAMMTPALATPQQQQIVTARRDDDMDVVTSATTASKKLEEAEQKLHRQGGGDHHRDVVGDSFAEGGGGDDDYVLPKCRMPSRDEYGPVEKFVARAVREGRPADKPYRVIVDSIRNYGKSTATADPPMVRNLLLALRTADGGATLSHIVNGGGSGSGGGAASSSSSSRSNPHVPLVHQLVRFDPFKGIPSAREAADAAPPTTPADGSSPPSFLPYDMADAHLHLLLAIVSSNSVFLVPALTSIWKLLIQPSWPGNEQYAGADDIPGERTRRLHAALASIMRLCPKAKSEIYSVVASNAPFRNKTEKEMVWYYEQCLEMLRYHPSMRSQVLELLIDKCLEMDVEIKITDVGEAMIDDEEKDDEEGIFELELDDKPKESPKKATTALAVVGAAAAGDDLDAAKVQEMADKLDSLMLLLFEYTAKFRSASSLGELYRVISRVFESTVLICHKSKFVQFLLFYVCGQESKALAASPPSPSSADRANLVASVTPDDGRSDDRQPETAETLYRDFAASLIEIVVDPYRATVTRQTGACYLASFVSRASFVCAETVCESVSALLRWAEAYVETQPSLSGGNAIATMDDAKGHCSLHSLFYTVCQAAFYIMCFRGAEALRFFRKATENGGVDGDGDDGVDSHPESDHIDIGPGRWTELCSHSTQPLRFCLESVRSEFLVLARRHGLVDPSVLDTLESGAVSSGVAHLQRKKRLASTITTAATLEKERLRGGVGGLGKGTNPLDSFFPFDPYLLERSHVFLEPYYIHWCGTAGGDGAFDSINEANDDDNVSDASDEDDGNDEDDGDDDDDDDDEDDSSRVNGDDVEPMSLASTAASSFGGGATPNAATPLKDVSRESVRQAWTDTLKRTRASSVENGSW